MCLHSSKSYSSPKNYVIVLSFHDLRPHSLSRCEDFLNRLKTLGVNRISLLVVPCWYGGVPFTAEEVFVMWLRDRAQEGHDICLHGYSHKADRVSGGPVPQFLGRVYTHNEGEFFQMEKSEAERKLKHGIALFRQAGLPVYGFTPPAWLISDEALAVVKWKGFHYTTGLNHIYSLRNDKSIYAPVIVFSSRTLLRRGVSQVWVRFWWYWNRTQPIIRLAVHPIDLLYPSIADTIYSMVETALKQRTPMTYQDVIKGHQVVEPLTA
jgi:hypothetical protein